MKQGFYTFFYKKIPNEAVCVVLSTMVYFVYCLKYFIKKLFADSRKVEMTEAQAKEIITRHYPKVEDKAEIINLPINNEVDLSVIMPVYNYEDIIEGTIESVLNQKTKYNYELIIVDDGSRQAAKDILEKYKSNPKVKVIHQENGGIGVARNTGLNNAVGKYIMFVDCDDTVHDDIVEVLMSKATENDIDMVMCAHNLSKESKGVITSVTPNIYPKYNLMGYKDGDYIMNFPGLPWCKVYKRKMFNNVRFLPGYWYEDTIVQFLLYRVCDSFEYIPSVKYEYRWYEKNFSHIQTKAPDRVVQRYWILERCIEETERMGLKKDAVFYKLLIRHLGSYYLNSLDNMDEKSVDALFCLAAELLKKNKPTEKYHLPYALREIEKYILKQDINRWKMACSIQ